MTEMMTDDCWEDRERQQVLDGYDCRGGVDERDAGLATQGRKILIVVLALLWMKNESCCRRAYGQRYKSAGEEQIARLLDRNGIGYCYEYPLAIMDDGKLRIYYPDFSLPGYGLIIEYFGMRGDPAYDRQASRKMNAYRNAGIDGLFITPDSFKGDWPRRIMGEIDGMLASRLERFRGRQAERVGR